MEHAFTPSQKLALLMVRRMSRDSLSWKVSEAMRAMGIGYGSEDLRMLVAEGLIEKRGTRHNVLPRGVAISTIVARRLAEQYRIHHIERRNGAGNMGPSISCTCGWSMCTSNRNRNQLESRAARHLQAVAAGTWTPRRTIDEIVAASFTNPGAYSSSPMGDPHAPGTRGAVPSSHGTAPVLYAEAGHA